MIKYFKELLDVLKSIDRSLKLVCKCVESAPDHGRGRGKTVIKTSHWND